MSISLPVTTGKKGVEEFSDWQRENNERLPISLVKCVFNSSAWGMNFVKGQGLGF